MVLAVLVGIALAVIGFEILWRLALAMIVWAPILFCSVAAMQRTSKLQLADPLAPLYAFLVAGLIGRLALSVTVGILRRVAGENCKRAA